ncbi:MAG: hypothetical protein IT538_12780, partial [Variibacter sp.]|nr:hypothetical protein [Variibacter sp.]
YLATMVGNLGRALFRLNRREESVTALREVVGTYRALADKGEPNKGEPNPALAIELVEALRELALVDPSPQSLLREALGILRRLEAQGKLSDDQKGWIAEIEKALAEKS